MNTKPRTIPTEFGAETSFDVTARQGVAPRGGGEAGLESLRKRLLKEALKEWGDAVARVALHRAAGDAAALAAWTAYPLLVFPELFAEKARTAVVRARRQQRIFQRSRALLEEVV
jgi:hypothetical protein